MRWGLSLLFMFLVASCAAQEEASGPALGYTRTINVPLNAVLLFDRSLDAWNWTFGREPGAKLVLSDRGGGVIEGTARLNFRSAQLSLREETTGVIQYRAVISIKAGECRISISELTHTGNRGTPRGGLHMGLLARGDMPIKKVRGAAGASVRKAYEEIKQVSEARVLTLLQAFEARLRASSDP